MKLFNYTIERRDTVLTECGKIIPRRRTRWAWRGKETHKYAGAISIAPDKPAVQIWWGLRMRVDRVVDSWPPVTCEACVTERYPAGGLRSLLRRPNDITGGLEVECEQKDAQTS